MASDAAIGKPPFSRKPKHYDRKHLQRPCWLLVSHPRQPLSSHRHYLILEGLNVKRGRSQQADVSASNRLPDWYSANDALIFSAPPLPSIQGSWQRCSDKSLYFTQAFSRRVFYSTSNVLFISKTVASVRGSEIKRRLSSCRAILSFSLRPLSVSQALLCPCESARV